MHGDSEHCSSQAQATNEIYTSPVGSGASVSMPLKAVVATAATVTTFAIFQ